MNAQLHQDLEHVVMAQVGRGRFRSSGEVIAEALRRFRQQQEVEEARGLEGIRQSLDDIRAGRDRPAVEVFEDIRREFNLPRDA